MVLLDPRNEIIVGLLRRVEIAREGRFVGFGLLFVDVFLVVVAARPPRLDAGENRTQPARAARGGRRYRHAAGALRPAAARGRAPRGCREYRGRRASGLARWCRRRRQDLWLADASAGDPYRCAACLR